MSNSSNKTNNKKIPLVSITTAIQFFVTISFVIICVFLVICSFWLESLLFLDYNFHLRLLFFLSKILFLRCLRSSNLKQTFRAFFTMILFSPFFSFSVKCCQPLGPAVVEVVVAPAAVAAVAGGAVVVVVVWKVSLDGLEGWGKPFTLNPVGHEERVLDHDPAFSAGQS
jgi:hypothetical protein